MGKQKSTDKDNDYDRDDNRRKIIHEDVDVKEEEKQDKTNAPYRHEHDVKTQDKKAPAKKK